MAISTTSVLAHQYQHIGHAGFQEKWFTDNLVGGTTQIQHGLVRILSLSVCAIDGSTDAVGVIDNNDGTVTVNGTGTQAISVSVRGY